MISYQQPLLFSFEEWFKDTEWDDRLQAIRDPVPVGPALSALLRPARKARLSSHDPSEHIPTTKALRERLRRDPVLRWVGYRGPSDIPSAVTFSRLFDPRSQCTSLQAVHAQQVETGRERRIVSTVAAGSLFPLAALTTTATRHDVNMARPLVPITTDRNMGQQVAIFDAGYDQAMLYQDLHEQELIPIIPLNHHGVEAPESRDALGRPTCSVGYPLTLAGYDATTETQKFRCPHATGHVECPRGMAWCASFNYGYVQKIAIADNPREVGRIVRGIAAWDALYDLRTSVDQAFSYLTEQRNLWTVRMRGRRKVHTHHLFAVIALAASVLASTV